MNHIYLVSGFRHDYEDPEHWVVRACGSELEALVLERDLKKALAAACPPSYAGHDTSAPACPKALYALDPYFGGATGPDEFVEYSVEPVPFVSEQADETLKLALEFLDDIKRSRVASPGTSGEARKKAVVRWGSRLRDIIRGLR